MRALCSPRVPSLGPVCGRLVRPEMGPSVGPIFCPLVAGERAQPLALLGREVRLVPVVSVGDAAERRVVELGLDASVEEVGVPERRLLEAGAGELGALEVRGFEPRLLELRAFQVGALEMSGAQLRLPEVCAR